VLKLEFEQYDKKLDQLCTFLESVDDVNSATARSIVRNMQQIAKEKLAYTKKEKQRVEALYESGDIDLDYRNEAIAALEDGEEETLKMAYPCYEEAQTGKALSIIGKECKALAKYVPGAVVVGAGCKLIDVAAKKWILSRLKKYTLLHPDAISVTQLTSEPYTVQEAVAKYHIKFRLAYEWAKSPVATRCVVYKYNNKVVMAIAYSKDGKDIDKFNGGISVETVIYGAEFHKHEDYYNAYMCSRVQISHPSVKRVLDKMKSEWKQKAKTAVKKVEESVEEYGIEGETYLITESVKEKFLTMEEAEYFKQVMNHYCG
jgi:hypothetical protein